MAEPHADRPHMPGYGIETDRAGLLSWAWAEAQLTASHEYWLATVATGGRPHLMPVWGVWAGRALWFSAGLRSRKARNLAGTDRCTLATDAAHHPVVVEGRANPTADLAVIATFAAAVNAKYATDYPADFYDPAENGVFRVQPTKVIALDDEAFTTSPTRWSFA